MSGLLSLCTKMRKFRLIRSSPGIYGRRSLRLIWWALCWRDLSVLSHDLCRWYVWSGVVGSVGSMCRSGSSWACGGRCWSRGWMFGWWYWWIVCIGCGSLSFHCGSLFVLGVTRDQKSCSPVYGCWEYTKYIFQPPRRMNNGWDLSIDAWQRRHTPVEYNTEREKYSQSIPVALVQDPRKTENVGRNSDCYIIFPLWNLKAPVRFTSAVCMKWYSKHLLLTSKTTYKQ